MGGATDRPIVKGNQRQKLHPPEEPLYTGHPEVVTPPAPPGESAPEAVRKTQAVADALVQLGEIADPKRVAEAVKAQAGIDLDPNEVSQIMAVLRNKAKVPPGPDQPPPENARGN